MDKDVDLKSWKKWIAKMQYLSQCPCFVREDVFDLS